MGDVVELRAEASDEDGIVTSLRFLNGEEDLGEAVAPLNSLSWQPTQPGTNYVSAVATDNLGATTRTPAAWKLPCHVAKVPSPSRLSRMDAT